MTPPCLNSWSGCDSQSSTPAYSSGAASSATTFDIIYITLPTLPFSLFFLSLSMLPFFIYFHFYFAVFATTSPSHQRFVILSFPCSLPSSPSIHPILLLSPSLSLFIAVFLSLFCSFSPCTWLCPIAVLAKRRADETVLNSVICQHIQPRKLHCNMGFVFVSVNVCVCIHRSLYSICDYAYVNVYPAQGVWSSLCVYRCIQSNSNCSLMCHLLKCGSSDTLRLLNWEGPWLWTLTGLWLAVSAIQWRSFKSHHLDWQIKDIYRQLLYCRYISYRSSFLY